MSSDMEVTVAEVVDYLKITGRFIPSLRTVVERKVTAESARRAGVRVSGKDLQRASDVFRVSHDLSKASDMKRWMKAHGITQEVFEHYIETNLLISRFKDRLAKKTKASKTLASPVIHASIREMTYQDWLNAALK